MGLAAAVAGAGVLGAGASIYGGMTQANAANNATGFQKQMFDTLQGNLQPYNSVGTNAFQQLGAKLPSLTTPFDPSQLENTPGYQFTKQQGMNAVNNSNSAVGWGDSGPGAKGIADYVTGLAQSTYNQQFQNYWNQNQNIYSMLAGPSQIGANAAAGVGQGALTTGANVGSNMIGAGNAQAGSAIGAANALGGIPMNNALLQMLQSGGFGKGPHGGPAPAANDNAGLLYGFGTS